MLTSKDTIAAIATPPGKGGVGIVRVSGPKAAAIAIAIVDQQLKPRYASLVDFKDDKQELIDSGLALYFPGPNSFTGEDVLELQGHGGPVVMDLLLQAVVAAGARLARPGEFSERAFLNDKIDLAQAEAIADLIDAASVQAARSATRSLQGEFSQKINELVDALIHLRVYVEAAIDFPEEEIDFLSDGKVAADLSHIAVQLTTVMQTAKQGALLKDGMTVVLAGKPNAGKSSLLNCLSGRDSAIVTDVAGTTRDVLREHIQIDGLPLHIIDTAGLRDSDDLVEKEGIRRAEQAIEQADAVVLVMDSQHSDGPLKAHAGIFSDNKPVLVVWNKIDLPQACPAPSQENIIALSTKTGAGLVDLKEALKNIVQYNDNNQQQFIARRRHIEALNKAQVFVLQGQDQLNNHQAGELLAEDLLQAQNSLAEITGVFTADDLLGEIFSSFCIGK